MKIEPKRNRAYLALKAVTTLGPIWALQRTRIVLLNKFGVLEGRTPLRTWNKLSLAGLLKADVPNTPERYYEWRLRNNARFFFDEFPAGHSDWIGEESVRTADCILRGEFPFFGYHKELGFPPHWQQNPITQALAPAGHWSKLDEFNSGDVKLWWEPSRFSWAYALGRAFARTADERYADAFWQLVESWAADNPPFWGINWKCGQEASFRVMALCFAYYLFLRTRASSPQRVSLFLSLIALHAQRIHAFNEYGRSQKNNHGLSEAAGLWTIGTLFPEFKGAETWRSHGKELIESEIKRQIYPDGSYVQHSINYHRVMLHVLAWALRLGECNDDLLAPFVYDSFRNASRFLYALTDTTSGWAPNYGANDGALVLPLTDCAYPDMRPVLQSCHFLTEKKRLYAPGPWDEETAWLIGGDALRAIPPGETDPPPQFDAESGGYYTIRGHESWIMLRGAKYKDRPSHAEQLNVDLWWRGQNILCDPGTYSYNAEAPFDHGYASTRYHNTVTVDRLDQMNRLSRFLWSDWADADVRRLTLVTSGRRVLEGEHDGYTRSGVTHRRALTQVDDNIWLVVDDLTGAGEHTLSLHWLLPDAAWALASPTTLDLQTDQGTVRLHIAANQTLQTSLTRAGGTILASGAEPEDRASGWISRYYGRLEPALSLSAQTIGCLPVRYITVAMLGNIWPVSVDRDCACIAVGPHSLALNAPGQSPVFAQCQ
jgi:hypothetical protein